MAQYQLPIATLQAAGITAPRTFGPFAEGKTGAEAPSAVGHEGMEWHEGGALEWLSAARSAVDRGEERHCGSSHSPALPREKRMDRGITIGVVIPAYNAARFCLAASIRSLRRP